ncbi:hypothetical protein EGW08_008705, partial [Elysia chlorotica]
MSPWFSGCVTGSSFLLQTKNLDLDLDQPGATRFSKISTFSPVLLLAEPEARLIMTSLLRKCRVVPIQFVLAGAALLIYVIYSQRPEKINLESKWAELRDEELKKYASVREVGLEFVRKAGRVGNSIE